MRRRFLALLVLAGALAAGSAPMQCPAEDREPVATVPEAPEECYDLARRLLQDGDVAGWRTALQYVIDRFPDSRYAARARDDLAHGPAGTTAAPGGP